ncbi:alpha/beta fold hydrolase [Streptomyces sp. NPDC002181]|uniref:alpha/beta fold hydrolase n=1 Tax=Streptomyces sp. NPDC002181 TaxID=3364635 RepID=UPI0036ACA3BD
MAHAEIHGAELYYETAGEGDAVVLIHGWGASLRVWDRVITDLSADHHLIAYDWRGCGRSDRTSWGNTIVQNAADLRTLVDRLGLERPVLVGSSVGSLFACQAARTDGGRFSGIVVIDGPGHWAHVRPEPLRGLLGSMAADRAAAIAGFTDSLYTRHSSEALRTWTARQILDASPHIDNLMEEQIACDPREWLADIAVPLTYIHGSLDSAVPVDVPQELAALTGSTLTVIPDAGHLPHQERPLEVATAIRTFVAGLRLSG